MKQIGRYILNQFQVSSNPLFDGIFRKFTRTYYYSALFFPKQVGEDVAILYSFVRLADEFVDNPVANPKRSLEQFRKLFYREINGQSVDHEVVHEFSAMIKRVGIKTEWVESFLAAMAMDLTIKQYATFNDLKRYTDGSAEVIGLMMGRIIGVPDQGLVAARKLGLSMQLINFLRDIKEDWARGRIYLPQADLKKFGITPSEWGSTINSKKFNQLMAYEIARVKTIQHEAELGFSLIPGRCRKAVKIASALYLNTLNQIEKDPMLVWQRKVQPSYWQISQRASISWLFDNLA